MLPLVALCFAATLEVAGGTLEVTIPKKTFTASQPSLLAWIETSAKATAAWYGAFPVPRATITLAAANGFSGTAFPSRHIDLRLDPEEADFAEDWVCTHEMVHLGFPTLPDAHLWMSEGMATYVEPIARAKIGQVKPTQVWRELVAGLPKGQPEKNDRGLDHTPTWGRTYWGGALFWLVADVAIRERTRNAKSLQDALRAVWKKGGTLDSDWTAERVVSVGDEATGTTVLRETYARMKAAPAPVDLEALWKRLGVVVKGKELSFDDAAPAAAIRRSITAP